VRLDELSSIALMVFPYKSIRIGRIVFRLRGIRRIRLKIGLVRLLGFVRIRIPGFIVNLQG